MQTDKKQDNTDNVTPEPEPIVESVPKPAIKVDDTLNKVVERINDADSILVALSKDPTVDEMTAALGLTMMLDKMGKHATAIYSGKTPNALEFLKPDETFEANTNSLQDFIIALAKEKADHLRYKIEGDFVKVYITPYKTTITENDLEFSRGEVNVDLVISLDVVEAEDLDAALATHGRIMHNASLINISNSAPGRLGGVEWSNPQASSVSEMIVTLFEVMGQEIPKEVATALLTGIVAATERFSNERTTPETMALASRLMQLGADQQLIVAQIMSAKEEEPTEAPAETEEPMVEAPAVEASVVTEAPSGPGMIDIKHEEDVAPAISEPVASEPVASEPVAPEPVASKPAKEELSPEQQLEQMIAGAIPTTDSPAMQPTVMQELKNLAEAPTEEAPAVEPPKMEEMITEAPIVTEAPMMTEAPIITEAPTMERPVIEPPKAEELVASVPPSKVPVDNIYQRPEDIVNMQDKNMAPLQDETEKPKDYGAMMEEALAEPINNPAIMATPVVPAQPEVQPADDINAMVNQMVSQAQAQPIVQPVVEQQPQAMTGGVELPPPPAPDVANMMSPTEPAPMPVSVLTPAPSPSLPPVQMPEMTQPVMAPQPVAIPQPVAMPQGMQPVQPVQPVQEDASEAQLIPTAPEGVKVQAEPVNPVVVQPTQNEATVAPMDDPTAFKIPGL